MEYNKSIMSNESLYRGQSLIAINKDAVEQRINILNHYLGEELQKHYTEQDNAEIIKLEKAINFWKFIRENHC